MRRPGRLMRGSECRRLSFSAPEPIVSFDFFQITNAPYKKNFSAFLSFQRQLSAKFSDTEGKRSQITTLNVGFRPLAVKEVSKIGKQTHSFPTCNIALARRLEI